MFNDDAGFELVNLQAQRDLNSLVKNDERRHVNRDRTTTIDKDETITVHGKRTEVVDKDEHITIHQNRTEVVDKDETITIHQNRQERVDENETIDIGGNRTETVHKSEKILIKGNRDKTINGNDTLNVDKNRKENVHKSRSLNVDKTNTEFVKLGKSVTVGLGYATQVGTIMNTAVGIMQTEQVGRIKKTFVGKSYSITAGDEFKITVGKSSLVMNADGSIIITGSSIITQAEGENKVIGKDVLINPPGASNGGKEDEPDYVNDEPAEIGPDGLPVLGSDSDEYESNIAVDSYDKYGNLLGSHDLEDNPSGLLAMGSTKGLKKDTDPFEPVYVDDEQESNAIWTAVNEATAYIGRTFDKITGVPMAIGEPAAAGAYGILSVYEANLNQDYKYYASGLGLRPMEDYSDPTYLKIRKKVDWGSLTQKYGHNGFEKAKPEMYKQIMK